MTAMQYAMAPRFRLRFMLQEFELGPGDTLIGRSEECHITLFDPLISRRHARIRVIADRAVLEDLGSRNGCRVNGVAIRGTHTLSSGDRIGKHEFVFGEFASAAVRKEKPTGSLVFCGACDTVYPGEVGSCPSCGSSHALDEERRLGGLDESIKHGWAIEMMLQLFERSLGAKRFEDADRTMQQVTAMLENVLSSATAIDRAKLGAVSEATMRLAEAQDSGYWVRWAADFYERAGFEVPAELAHAAEHWDREDPKTAQQ
jgi:hypothetical protein